ncbi:amino acid transporter [Aspergillus steynii IBT 23096]|uniref:Amino acid transporter n=1 Tax=Aspergillus steynii IBT 23096 TaxID=1392250 RepID=A0A2I2GPU8_9EURO|nr:amino acid transporter [Aspergillus steynii IBT 23096]PLB54902.1 amino acid transporter [Aspergillus steynii IBT 23096]
MSVKDKQHAHGTRKLDIDDIDTQCASQQDIVPIHSGQLHRRLNYRQIQIMAIGGSVGTALFVNIGGGLAKGGPLSLLLGFTIYSLILSCINNCIAEMTVLHPTPGGFIRMAGKWVDEAFEFMAGWNFFIYEALLVPFEITALTMTLSFWRDDIPAGAVCAACIVAYSLLNVFAVRVYGEVEFWGSGGKVVLIAILFSFTFVAMVGGNPQHDAFGFRNWKDPGPMATYLSSGDLGRFEGFLGSLWMGSFTIVGPDYVALIAAEAQHPRTYVKKAFQTIYWRFGIFFVLAALSVGILLPYNDPTLIATFLSNGSSGAKSAGSPFIIAMRNMQISILPDIMNALLVTTIFSAGNTYLYCSSRSLYALSLDGRAPRILQKCTKQGVPIYCVLVVILFPLLSLLQLGNGSSQALTWLTNILTAGGLINYFVMAVTYLFFYRACQVQGVDRTTLPYYGRFQPYTAWIGAICEGLIVIFYGYESFRPWDLGTFFSNYTLVILAPILYSFWKILKRTKIVSPREADLVWERPIVDSYEASMISKPQGFWAETLQWVGLRKAKQGND